MRTQGHQAVGTIALEGVPPLHRIGEKGDDNLKTVWHGTAACGATLILLVLLLFSSMQSLSAEQTATRSPLTPELISIFPLGGQQGTLANFEVRGKALDGAEVWFDVDDIKGRVKKIEEIEIEERPEEASHGGPKKALKGTSVTFEAQIKSSVLVGSYSIRMVTPRGISNALPFLVYSESVVFETGSPHNKPVEAQVVKFPTVISGRIDQNGETDYFSFDASKDQELLFEAISKPAFTASLVSGGFPMEIALYEPTGSWFDPHQVSQLADRDESTPGTEPTHPILSFRFPRKGRYLVGVRSSSGKGGVDYSYQLRIVPASSPSLFSWLEKVYLPKKHSGWVERDFRRKLEADRLHLLWSRTVRPTNAPTSNDSVKSAKLAPSQNQADDRARHGGVKDLDRSPSRMVPEIVKEKEPNDTPSQATEVTIPSIIEGIIDHPGDVDSFRFKVKRGESLAFEVETPDAAVPLFNPRLAVLDESGHEFLTNIWKKISRNFTFYMKSLEPKTIYTIELGGEYCLQIRDATFRYGDHRFAYRILIRPQIPHMGEIDVKEDHINLASGEAKKLNVVTGQEEGFKGDIALSMEGLPPGVTAFPGTEVKPDKGPALDEGYKERFVPKQETASIILAASPTAVSTSAPWPIRVVARPVVEGILGPPLMSREIPLMIVKQADSMEANQGASHTSR